MARLRSTTTCDLHPLADAWTVAPAAPGTITGPEAALDALDWLPARVPGTAALAWQDAGRWTLDDRKDFDDDDWWFRVRFDHPNPAHEGTCALRFGGLATIADVWLNGTLILHSENMFVEHEVALDRLTSTGNVLVIRCASVNAWLRTRRPRPGWRTRLVRHQQLRWLRTSLIGRIPAWMPSTAPVGPWRPVQVVLRHRVPQVRTADVRTGWGPDGGRVTARIRVDTADAPESAVLVVGGHEVPLRAVQGGDGMWLEGEGIVADADAWWPHTHGEPTLYDARVDLRVGGERHTVGLGRLGFRSIEADVAGDGFSIVVNGERVFCRGACWITADPVGLGEDREQCERALTLGRDGGMNMVRIVGTAAYGSDAFFDVCDELGILVWQDFPFANLDYPGHDPDFRAAVQHEVDAALERLQAHPALAVLCGGSEVFQQAAMLGLPEDAWRNPIYDEVLPAAVRTWCDGLPYVASSPDGGALPIHNSSGVAHYFGVGAYRRPLTDARRSGVRFTSECLGFANVPEPAAVEAVFGGAGGVVHDPRWKARVPRDPGAGWDFDDIRDHYFAELFGTDPLDVRYHDPERYLALSRVVSGEVMATAFAEWRRDGSSCRGGLVWKLRDLWLGAGWGVIDATDTPKACYYYLRRAWAPRTVFFTDEGLNGLYVHGVNDGADAWETTVEVRLMRADGAVVAEGTRSLKVPGRECVSVAVDAILGRFTDASWVHRFGPPNHDVVEACARDAGSDGVTAEAHYFVDQLIRPAADHVLAASAVPCGEGAYDLTVSSPRFARAVSIDAPGFLPEDNYFNLSPRRPRTVRLRPGSGPEVERFRAHVGAVNAGHAVRAAVESGEQPS